MSKGKGLSAYTTLAEAEGAVRRLLRGIDLGAVVGRAVEQARGRV